MHYDVIRAVENKRGWVTHQVVNEDGQVEQVQYGLLFAGLAWPGIDSPAYFCILGEEFVSRPSNQYDEEKPNHGKVRLLAEVDFEGKGISIEGIFREITDIMTHMACKRIFTDMSEEYIDFSKAFFDYCTDNGANSIRLEPAPFSKNPRVGIGTVKDWFQRGRLEIPSDTAIYQQLKQIGAFNFAESQDQFHAVTGFRYALGAFHKFKPSYRRSRRRRLSAMTI